MIPKLQGCLQNGEWLFDGSLDSRIAVTIFHVPQQGKWAMESDGKGLQGTEFTKMLTVPVSSVAGWWKIF